MIGGVPRLFRSCFIMRSPQVASCPDGCCLPQPIPRGFRNAFHLRFLRASAKTRLKAHPLLDFSSKNAPARAAVAHSTVEFCGATLNSKKTGSVTQFTQIAKLSDKLRFVLTNCSALEIFARGEDRVARLLEHYSDVALRSRLMSLCRISSWRPPHRCEGTSAHGRFPLSFGRPLRLIQYAISLQPPFNPLHNPIRRLDGSAGGGFSPPDPW